MDWVTKTRKKEAVVELMRSGDWLGVLQQFNSEEYREPLLLWIRPSLSSLEFIRDSLSSLHLTTVSSVGCGCGTLEWLLASATGLTVRGYEVNRMWWEGEHSTPHFIDIGVRSLHTGRETNVSLLSRIC